VIVGGGPAGSAAARTLSSAGISACIIDKYTFPREKLCGGLLTLRSKKIYDEVFDISWDPVIEAVSRGVALYYHDRLLHVVEDYKDLHFTYRYNFDNFLLRQAERQGAKLFLGDAVRGINSGDSTVTLGDGTLLTYKYLIGADGINSIVAKTLFKKPFDQETMAFGLEMEVPMSADHQRIHDPEIYFGVVRWGYGWVFPKKDSLTVGMGGSYKKNQNIKTEFLNFLKMRFGNVPEAEIKGHYIPFGDYRMQPGKNNIFLCGDAAGLVDPITGEGIAFAMQSGYLAGLSIVESFRKPGSATAFNLYREKYKKITSVLVRAKILRNLIFPKVTQRIFVSLLSKTTSVPRKHMDLMAGDIEYGEYAHFILSKICKAILKRAVTFKS
jgi:geranylgeranyl reductase family protein